ncbi:MAG: tetratricopeptide repeat protein [Planctomycetota bacterium]
MFLPRGCRLLIPVCVLLLLPKLAGAENEDAAYKYNDEKKSKKGGKDTKTVKAVAYHTKNLKDSDPEVRQSSCEMLAIIGSPIAIPSLIDVLRPERKEPLLVMLTAHGALVKITGKNFGYKAYDEWMSWWSKNKEEFLKKVDTGPDEKSKIGAKASNELGMQLMRMGEYRSAQAHFTNAVSAHPTEPDYRNNLGLSLMEQGRYLDAMEHFDELTGLNPDLPQPYMNIGRCYSRMARSIESEAWYKKAMARDKAGRLWDLCWMIGKEYMKRNEWTLAFEYLDQARLKAEKQSPIIREPHLHKDLAITHYGMDQYHSAYKELMNLRTLGFEPDKGFLEKVRKALKDQGIDPELEDKKAREVLRNNFLNEDTEETPKP